MSSRSSMPSNTMPPSLATTTLSPDVLGVHLQELRQTPPLVHNLTNFVAMNSMANILLALGASPAMVHAPEEVTEFAALADAVTINIGTLSASWVESMFMAARSARQHDKPWVFDPVGVGATRYRRDVAAQLLALKPTVIRGNASEIMTLAHQADSGRGVDTTAGTDEALQAAIALASTTSAVVAVTGEVDLVTDGQRLARIPGGHELMPRVTTLGCSLAGVIAAFISRGSDTFEATIAALACYAEAGRQAGLAANGPGSFSSAFLDALYNLNESALSHLAPVEIDHVC